MPWTEKNYPNSMKNLNPVVRKKAIDILNAMIEEGYKEENAIPISISQAKKWVEDATLEDKKLLKKKDVTKHKDNPENTSSRLQNRDVLVKYDTKNLKWIVITEGAKKADSRYETKKDAIKRAKEIATNKNVKVKAYTKQESI